MYPKSIIIKTCSKEFYIALLYKLKNFKNIRLFNIKFNGSYTITIKCYNYYNQFNCLSENKLYGNYTFLYSIVSILLSELFITYYENSISKRIIFKKSTKLTNLNKLSNVSSLLLDINSPLEFSKPLYYKRKRYLLNALFKNFRKCNYIFVEHFINFMTKDYTNELEEIISAALEILNNKSLYDYLMNFVFSNDDTC